MQEIGDVLTMVERFQESEQVRPHQRPLSVYNMCGRLSRCTRDTHLRYHQETALVQ